MNNIIANQILNKHKNLLNISIFNIGCYKLHNAVTIESSYL